MGLQGAGCHVPGNSELSLQTGLSASQPESGLRGGRGYLGGLWVGCLWGGPGWVGGSPSLVCQFFHCCSPASQPLLVPPATTAERYLAAPLIPEHIWQNCPSLRVASISHDLGPPWSVLRPSSLSCTSGAGELPLVGPAHVTVHMCVGRRRCSLIQVLQGV